MLNEYSPKDVYNCDEAGVQYGVTAKKTLAFKGEACHGRKQPKQRVTVLFCANMDGSDKKQVFVIGKSFNPRCMPKHIRRPCPYKANTKAWMTSEIFEEYLRDWDRKLTKQNRRIALTLDNATCHPHIDLINIKLVFLPPNTTSHLQPMDQGIIANFKRQYRFLYTMRFLCPAVETGKKLQFNILHALKLFVQAWDAVTPRTISRCFRHAGFINPNVPVLTPEEEQEENLPLSVLTQRHNSQEEDDLPLAELAQRLNSAGRVTDIGRSFTVESVDHVLNEDEGLETTGVPTTDDIVSHIQDGNNFAPEDNCEDEPDQEPPKKYSHNQLMQAMEIVEGFFVYQHGDEIEKMHHYALQLQAWGIRHQPNSSQTILDQYFVAKK